MKQRIIAFVNQKGGVGKTTATMNVGAGLAKAGRSVLLIDLDPQGNLTNSIGIDTRDSFTMYEFLKGKCTSNDLLIHKTGLDILPADIALAGAEMELSGEPGREFILREKIQEFNQDYILIDCSPSLSVLTTNALTAASEIFIPMWAEVMAMQGTAQLVDTVDLIQRRMNPGLKITGVIINMFDSRRNLHKEAAEAIEKRFPDAVFKTRIRNNVALAEAPGFKKDIFTYKSNSNGAIDYESLVAEVIDQEI